MVISRSLLFLVAAIVCFIIALLLIVGAVAGSNEQAWTVGGFLALALSFLP